jgi:mRNA interferase MazF
MQQIVGSVTVCLLTTDLIEEPGTLRVDIAPSTENGLRERSQVQVEKLMTFPRDKVRGPIGRIDPTQLSAVDIGLLVHLGLATQLGVAAR